MLKHHRPLCRRALVGWPPDAAAGTAAVAGEPVALQRRQRRRRRQAQWRRQRLCVAAAGAAAGQRRPRRWVPQPWRLNGMNSRLALDKAETCFEACIHLSSLLQLHKQAQQAPATHAALSETCGACGSTIVSGHSCWPDCCHLRAPALLSQVLLCTCGFSLMTRLENAPQCQCERPCSQLP